MLRGELRDDKGKVIGYVEGCSRGSTGPLCKSCKRGTSKHVCAYSSRAGICGAHVCESCAALDGDKAFCPVHRERAGLGPPPSVARYRERIRSRSRKANRPPRWIDASLYPGHCAACCAETKVGERILYFADRSVMCADCGEKFKDDVAEARRIERTAAQEEWDAREVYESSDGALTRRFLAELEKRGPAGIVASFLFKAQKASKRAKRYGNSGRGSLSYRDLAYERKGASLKELTAALSEHCAALGITFGWGRDESSYNPWVLYVELPGEGSGEILQVSFHSPERYDGPDYTKEWDGRRMSEQRIIAYCQTVIQSESKFLYMNVSSAS